MIAEDGDADGTEERTQEPAEGEPKEGEQEEIPELPAMLTEVREIMLAVRSQIEAFHHRSEAQEEIIRRMQSQIEELRTDQVRKLLKPVLILLANVHADARKAEAADFTSLQPQEIAREFDFLATHVEQAIEHLGFASVDAAPNALFDSELHTAGRTVATPDQLLDRCVAKVSRQGFKAPEDEKPLLYARVDVYRYEEEGSNIGDKDEESANQSPDLEEASL